MKKNKKALLNGLTEGEAALLLCILGAEPSECQKEAFDEEFFSENGRHLTGEEMDTLRAYPEPDDAIRYMKGGSTLKASVELPPR